jgi:hypothetical protein
VSAPTILDALRDRRLLGGLPAFQDLTTWAPWLTFLKVTYGLGLTSDELATFRRHTGRQTPRVGGYPEAVCIVGRQSGKSRIAANVAAYEAAVSANRGSYALLVSQDQRSAMRSLFKYAVEPFQLPAFAREVSKATETALELASDVTLATYPCRAAAVRGIRACVAVVDELAFFITSDGRPTDKEMLTAIRPTLATTGGRLLILSSPYGQSGALWDLHRQHYGREDSPVLVWQASAPAMNPTLPADYLDRMRAEDADAFRSEVEGEFRSGVASLFDSALLDVVTEDGVAERLPEAGRRYVAHFDASGGRADAAALAIGHRDGDAVVLDVLRRWPSPHNPESVIAEAAATLRTFGVYRVQVDRFAGEFPAAAFARHSITATTAKRTTAEHFLELLPHVNAGRLRLLDRPELLRELRGLERRRGTAGKDAITHPRGSHDDTAAALAGVVVQLAGSRDPSDLGITFGTGVSF